MTAEDVKALLRQHFGGDGAVIMEEVGNGTGFAQEQRRWADLVVMETWPSRGLVIHGVEVKISRHDWLNELRNPAKAEEIHRHCDYWWLAVTPGVVQSAEEVPARWGILEVAKPAQDLAGNPKPPRMVVVRQATREERPADLPRLFVAAMLRAMERADKAWLARQINEEVERRVQRWRRDWEKTVEVTGNLASKIALALRDAAAEEARWLNEGEAIRALRFAMRMRLGRSWGGVIDLLSSIATTRKKAEELQQDMLKRLEEAGVEVPEERLADMGIRRRKARRAG